MLNMCGKMTGTIGPEDKRQLTSYVSFISLSSCPFLELSPLPAHRVKKDNIVFFWSVQFKGRKIKKG